MIDRASALAFLQRYTDGDRDEAETLIGRHRVVVQVDPADCEWDTCSGWHMDIQFPEDNFPQPEGIPVDELIRSWPS